LERLFVSQKSTDNPVLFCIAPIFSYFRSHIAPILRRLFSIYKKEVFAFFNSLTGYLAVGIFLLVTGLLLWVFPDTSILDYGYATLESFFSLAPYLFMFLIPAITMRSIAGERAEGTLDLLISKPVSRLAVVTGKYLGSLTVVLLALIPTGLYYYAVYQLATPIGNVDTGAVLGSYIGLTLLASAFTAIGILTSAFSRNPVVAFLIAIMLCFFGFYAFDAMSRMPMFYGWENVLSRMGIQAHYEALSRGVLDSRDLIYFISIVVLTLAGSLLAFADSGYFRGKRWIQATVVVLSIVALNVLGGHYFGRLDFTAEKRYTLSPLSRETMQRLTQEVHVTVFLDGELPSGFDRLRRSTADLLADLQAYSDGRLKYSFFDPLAGDSKEQAEQAQNLIEQGLSPTNLTVRQENGLIQKLIFPGAIIDYGTEQIAVNLLLNRSGAPHEEVLNNSVQNLEYALVSAMRKVTTGGKPLVGFTEGHGEPSDLLLHDAIHSLNEGYQVGRVDLKLMDFEGLDQLDVLVVAKPRTTFSELEKYKLNYFVMNGGRILWAIDQLDASLDSLRATGSQTALANQLNLDDLLFTYGIRFNYDLIADLNCAQIPLTVGDIGGQPQIELVPWLFHPVFVPNTRNPVVKNLNGIRSDFSGTIDTISIHGIRSEIILQSSPFTRLLTSPASISLQMAGESPEPAEFRTRPYPVAATLEGSFPSVFLNRPLPDGFVSRPPVVPNKSVPTKMLAIADGDVFSGQVSSSDGSPYPLGWDRYTEQQYGNKAFLLNAVDYLADDSGIISLRAKEVKLRLLDPINLKERRLFWQLFNVGIPPILLVLFGFLQQYVRKRRYARRSFIS